MHTLNDKDMRLSVKTANLLPPKSTMLYNYRTSNDQICSQAFRGIFITLKTMLKNEVTQAEAINLRAVNYWHENVVPEPPKHSKLTEQHSYASALQRRIFQHVDLTSETSFDDDTNHDSSPRYSPTSPHTPQ
jgi:hypothetical protein